MKESSLEIFQKICDVWKYSSHADFWFLPVKSLFRNSSRFKSFVEPSNGFFSQRVCEKTVFESSRNVVVSPVCMNKEVHRFKCNDALPSSCLIGIEVEKILNMYDSVS